KKFMLCPGDRRWAVHPGPGCCLPNSTQIASRLSRGERRYLIVISWSVRRPPEPYTADLVFLEPFAIEEEPRLPNTSPLNARALWKVVLIEPNYAEVSRPSRQQQMVRR